MMPAMGKPVAKKGDQVVGLDTHIVMVSSPGGPVPTPMPMPFVGPLSRDLVDSVKIAHMPVAVVGSKADNTPTHIPMGGAFQKQPSNVATVKTGSSSIVVAHKKLACLGDSADCCNDPMDTATGQIVAAGTVLAG